MKKSLMVLLCGMGVNALAAEGENSSVEKTTQESGQSRLALGVDFGVHSKYLFRGMILNDDPVVQGALSASWDAGAAGTFGATIWANYDLTDYGAEQHHITEADYQVWWSHALGEHLSLELGFIYYDFPESAGITSDWEVYAKISASCFLNPYVTVYFDGDVAHGFYAMAGFSQDLYTVEEGYLAGTALNLSGAIGWADGDFHEKIYAGGNKGTLSDANLKFSVGIPLRENISLTPYVQFSTLLASARHESFENSDWITGVSLTMKF